jgi:hypothetical protein
MSYCTQISKRRKKEQLPRGDFATFVLQDVWEALKVLYFGLKLLLKQEKLLHFFCNQVLKKHTVKTQQALLRNGYAMIVAYGPEIFYSDADEWEKIKAVFESSKSARHLPPSLRKYMEDFRRPGDIKSLWISRCAESEGRHHRLLSQDRVDLEKEDWNMIEAYQGKFMMACDMDFGERRHRKSTRRKHFQCSSLFQIPSR